MSKSVFGYFKSKKKVPMAIEFEANGLASSGGTLFLWLPLGMSCKKYCEVKTSFFTILYSGVTTILKLSAAKQHLHYRPELAK